MLPAEGNAAGVAALAALEHAAVHDLICFVIIVEWYVGRQMGCYAAGHDDVALGCQGPHCAADVPSADRLHAIKQGYACSVFVSNCGIGAAPLSNLKFVYLDGCIHRIQHEFVIMVPLLKQLWRGACD